MYTSLFTTLALAMLGAQAMTVENPTQDTVWMAETSGQTVSWEAVSTDATSFAIQLVNQVSGVLIFIALPLLFARLSIPTEP